MAAFLDISWNVRDLAHLTLMLPPGSQRYILSTFSCSFLYSDTELFIASVLHPLLADFAPFLVSGDVEVRRLGPEARLPTFPLVRSNLTANVWGSHA